MERIKDTQSLKEGDMFCNEWLFAYVYRNKLHGTRNIWIVEGREGKSVKVKPFFEVQCRGIRKAESLPDRLDTLYLLTEKEKAEVNKKLILNNLENDIRCRN